MALVVAKPAAVIVLALFALFVRPQAGNQLELAVTVAGYLVLLGFLVWVWFFHKPKATLLPKSWYEEQYATAGNKSALGPCVAAVTPDGFVFSTPGVDTRYFWDAVQSVEADESAVSVWIGGTPVVTVPRRAFAGGDEFDRFVRAARDQLGEVRARVTADRSGVG
jgi:hypothetical protein